MARDLADGVWALDLGSVNAYLVDDGTVTLIDAGTPGAADELRAGIAEAGYTVEDIDRILITHYDFDHVGGLPKLATDAPIYAMEPDASMLEGADRAPLTNKKGLLQRVTDLFLTRPERSITRVRDGETIGDFTAYHTPGHTPGHTVYHHEDLGVMLFGDLVSEDNGELETPPWPLAYSNSRNRDSFRALAARGLEFEIACMGHGDPLTSGGAGALDRLAAE